MKQLSIVFEVVEPAWYLSSICWGLYAHFRFFTDQH